MADKAASLFDTSALSAGLYVVAVNPGVGDLKIPTDDFLAIGGTKLTLPGAPSVAGALTLSSSFTATTTGGVTVLDVVFPEQTGSGTEVTPPGASEPVEALTFSSKFTATTTGGVTELDVVIPASGASTLSLNGTAVADAALDPTQFSVGAGGVISLIETPFSGLSSPGSLSAAGQLIYVVNGTAFVVTMAQLAAEAATLTEPAISIGAIGAQFTGEPFAVTLTLANYRTPPTLTFADDAGEAVALPAGSTVTTTSATFTHPAVSSGSHTLTVLDQNNVEAVSAPYTAAPATATAAALSNVPSAALENQPISGVTVALTPAYAAAYAVLSTGGTEQGARIAFSGTTVPNLTPNNSGTYEIEIFAAATGGTALAASPAITVTQQMATSASIGAAPATGSTGTAISGVPVTLTPASSAAFAVLSVGGADEGSRQAFSSSTVPNLIPQGTGSYTIRIYAAATGGSPLATSTTITVNATATAAAAVAGAPAAGQEGQAITGLTTSLTPSDATAYAVLSVGGTDEGTRQAFVGTSLPSLTPQATGSYTARVYAAATGGTALAASAAIPVTDPATGATTPANAPATGSQGLPISGLTTTLTPSDGTAYAALFVGGAQEGSSYPFTGTAIPALTPENSGSYTVEVLSAATGGSALATSAAIAVAGSQAPPALASGTAVSMRLDTTVQSSVTSDSAYTTPQTTQGGVVRGWQDVEGNYSFNQTVSGDAGSLATNVANGNNAVRFLPASGVHFLNGPASLGQVIHDAVRNVGSGITIALVVKPLAITGTPLFLQATDPSGSYFKIYGVMNGSGQFIYAYYFNNSEGGTQSVTQVSGPGLFKIVLTLNATQTGTSGNMGVYINAITPQPVAQYNSSYDPSTTFGTVQIGQAVSTNGSDTVEILEFDVWPDVATGSGGASPTGDVATIMSYLTGKWGS